MVKDRGLTRRDVVVAGAAVGVGLGCGRTALDPDPDFDDEPAARWPEDDMHYDAPFTNPMVLSGNVVVNPNTDGIVPNASLANPLGLPMELLEVRFRLLPRGAEGDAASLSGLGLGVKMDLGKVPVVDAYMPVGTFGTSRDSYELQPYVYNDVEGGSLALSFPSIFSWRLKYPCFIPANSALACVVRPLGQNQFPVSVDVAYIVRTWDMRRPIPATSKVPWASSYESKGFDYITTAPAGSDVSSNLDIINPFSVPLELARFGARVSFLQNDDSTAVNSVFEDFVNGRDRLATMTMRSSRGFDIVRTGVSVGSLFPQNWRAWDIPGKWRMTPGEFYKVQLALEPVVESVPTPRSGQLQFSVAMTGYRDVPVAALAG